MSHPEAPDDPDGRPSDADRVTFTRSDLVLLKRAARENWAVPEKLQTEALWQTWKILSSDWTSSRDKISAMRFLTTADRTDVLAALAAQKLKNKDAGDDPADARNVLLTAAEAVIEGKHRVQETVPVQDAAPADPGHDPDPVQ